jgi:hypothetical protein
MSVPRFLLDEHVWGGLVKVGEDTYRFIQDFV